MSKLRVAIIGVGGAGLAMCQCLQIEPHIDQVVYERSGWVGGSWRYTKDTGEELNTPMYKNLRTNLPKEIMAYPDFPFPKHLPSFVLTKDVGKYLEDYAQHFDLMKHIKLEHEVLSVKVKYADDRAKNVWQVAVKNLRNNVVDTNVFDAVVVCSGHFEVPRIPAIAGLNTFPGKVIHSVEYDKPEDYKDQVIVVLGAGHSGIDICMDLSKFAKKIYLIHLKGKTCAKYPNNIEEVNGSTITAYCSDGYLEIDNGERRYADAVILCTGYLYSFPFLDPECGINVADNHVTPLYKHIFNIKYPSMSFVGICRRVSPFPNYAVQAKLIHAVLTSRKTLPSQEEMLQDEKEECKSRLAAGITRNQIHALGKEHQLQYCETIADLAGASCTYTPVMNSLYAYVSSLRAPYLETYKSKNFLINGDEWEEV